MGAKNTAQKERPTMKTINKQGGSLSISATHYLRQMGLSAGDEVYLVKTPNGFEVTRYDPEFADAMEAAREAMKRFPNALRVLAK